LPREAFGGRIISTEAIAARSDTNFVQGGLPSKGTKTVFEAAGRGEKATGSPFGSSSLPSKKKTISNDVSRISRGLVFTLISFVCVGFGMFRKKKY
jgi:hypothetical protein